MSRPDLFGFGPETGTKAEHAALSQRIRQTMNRNIRVQNMRDEEVALAQDDEGVPPGQAAQNALDIATAWVPVLERNSQELWFLRQQRTEMLASFAKRYIIG